MGDRPCIGASVQAGWLGRMQEDMRMMRIGRLIIVLDEHGWMLHGAGAKPRSDEIDPCGARLLQLARRDSGGFESVARDTATRSLVQTFLPEAHARRPFGTALDPFDPVIERELLEPRAKHRPDMGWIGRRTGKPERDGRDGRFAR